jgi:hypothetical protein
VEAHRCTSASSDHAPALRPRLARDRQRLPAKLPRLVQLLLALGEIAQVVEDASLYHPDAHLPRNGQRLLVVSRCALRPPLVLRQLAQVVESVPLNPPRSSWLIAGAYQRACALPAWDRPTNSYAASSPG